MEVAAAEAERTDGGAARVVGTRNPGASFRIDIKGSLRGHYGSLWFRDFDRWRKGLVIEGQSRLDQTGSPGCGLGMTNLRLDRAERTPWPVSRTKDLAQSRDLNGITDLGPRTVPFDQFNRFRRHAGLLISPHKRFFLPGSTRFIDRSTAAVT